MPTLRSGGFSLVELMISIAIGLFVLAGVISIYASSVRSNGDALKMTELNQELRAAMDVMTRDIRRSGYWGGNLADPTTGAISAVGAGTANNNDFDALVIGAFGAEAANSCITYQYDEDGIGGAVTDNDRFGFRLNDTAVESRQAGLACSAGDWEDITDDTTIEITQLLFTLIVQAPIDLDGTGPNTSTINVREVQITLAGQLKNDAEVNRTLNETVRIRTDKWLP